MKTKKLFCILVLVICTSSIFAYNTFCQYIYDCFDHHYRIQIGLSSDTTNSWQGNKGYITGVGSDVITFESDATKRVIIIKISSITYIYIIEE